MHPIVEQPTAEGAADHGGEIVIVSLAQVERVTGIPEIVPIAALVVLIVWAILRMARSGPGTLEDGERRRGSGDE